MKRLNTTKELDKKLDYFTRKYTDFTFGSRDGRRIMLYEYYGDDEDVVIPNGVEIIGKTAFLACDSMTNVTIPRTVIDIDPYAFCDCRMLTSVTIPASVTNIGKKAFYNCIGLKEVIIMGNPEIADDAFDDDSIIR